MISYIRTARVKRELNTFIDANDMSWRFRKYYKSRGKSGSIPNLVIGHDFYNLKLHKGDLVAVIFATGTFVMI